MVRYGWSSFVAFIFDVAVDTYNLGSQSAMLFGANKH